MSDNLLIRTCPTCGSDQIHLVVKDLTREYQRQAYIVPGVEFYECPNCGERIYDKTAMRKIAEHSPAYHHEGIGTAD